VEQNLLLDDIDNRLPKVKTFLDIININSAKSKKSYRIGLGHAQTFLNSKGETLETIIKPLLQEKMDRYELVQEFINYLAAYRTEEGKKIQPTSIHAYLSGFKSYLAYNRIYYVTQEYKARVREPKVYVLDRESEAIDGTDIRNILLNTSNRRLKAFLLILASGGTRSMETLKIRWKDIEFNSPTKINLHAENTKTATGRYCFISDEATRYLNDWKEYKYRPRAKKQDNIEYSDDALVFTVYDDIEPNLDGVYKVLSREFIEVLKTAKMNNRKSGVKTRQITFHQFRAFVYSTLSDRDEPFANWMLGHKNSTYWRKKPELKKQKYLECVKYLTYIDDDLIKKMNNDFQGNLDEKEQEIQNLKQQMQNRDESMRVMKDQLQTLVSSLSLGDQTTKNKMAKSLIDSGLFK
jgi:integrase